MQPTSKCVVDSFQCGYYFGIYIFIHVNSALVQVCRMYFCSRIFKLINTIIADITRIHAFLQLAMTIQIYALEE